jgi:hypothetical protein
MTTRRLAAILAADVVGFSSMMERDEESTLRLLKATQRATSSNPRVREHHGRIVKTRIVKTRHAVGSQSVYADSLARSHSLIDAR